MHKITEKAAEFLLDIKMAGGVTPEEPDEATLALLREFGLEGGDDEAKPEREKGTGSPQDTQA